MVWDGGDVRRIMSEEGGWEGVLLLNVHLPFSNESGANSRTMKGYMERKISLHT
jgi:hypothetical protein